MSGDEQLINAYKQKKDLYATMAARIHHNDYWDNMEAYQDGTPNPEGKKRRSAIKKLVLAILYGMGADSLSTDLNISKEEAQKLIDDFYAGYPTVHKFIEGNKESVHKYGYVKGILGRRRRLPDALLPKYTIKRVSGSANNFNPFLFTDNVSKLREDDLVKKYREKLNSTKGWREAQTIISDAKKDGVVITNNGGFISRAERQSTNAIIQGCLTHDTKIITKDGIKSIGDAVGDNVVVWDGEQWTHSKVVYSGKKRLCVLTTVDGEKILCSPDHRFQVTNTNGKTTFKKLSEIKPSYHWLNVASGAFSTGSSAESIKNLVPHVGKHANNRHDYSFDGIQGDFDRGVVLGRISSDGSYIMRGNGHGVIYLYVAEHEYDVLEYLKSVLPYKYIVSTIQKKNQKLYRITIYSTSLCEECIALDLKHQIHNIFYSNSEMLRGFLCGMFDGDGGVNTYGGVLLTFGTQCDFASFTEEIRDALYLFGIRSVAYKFNSCYRVSVRKSNCKRFASVIGFINKHKQELAESISTVRDGHTFDFRNVVRIKSIEITDEFVDMYDVCDTERGCFVANGFVVHNSAATITKLAMIAIDADEKLKNLGFNMLICVHDEILGECPRENSDKVAERLSQVMVESAAKVCTVPMKCDCYEVSRWYEDDFSNAVHDKYVKAIEKGATPEEEQEELLRIYDMINPEKLKEMMLGTYECNKYDAI